MIPIERSVSDSFVNLSDRLTLWHVGVPKSAQTSLEYSTNTQLWIICEQLEINTCHGPDTTPKIECNL